VYRSYAELGEKLRKLVEDQFGLPKQAGAEGLQAELEGVRHRIPEVVKENPGIHMGGIASAISLPVDLTQTLVRPMVGESLETRGVRRGTKYFLQGEAPPQTEDEGEDSGEPAGTEERDDLDVG